jgi:hypothetical protein
MSKLLLNLIKEAITEVSKCEMLPNLAKVVNNIPSKLKTPPIAWVSLSTEVPLNLNIMAEKISYSMYEPSQYPALAIHVPQNCKAMLFET